MKKPSILSNAAAEELSRRVSDERLRHSGVDIEQLADDPDLIASVQAIKHIRDHAPKLSVSDADIRKLAGLKSPAASKK